MSEGWGVTNSRFGAERWLSRAALRDQPVSSET